MKCDFYKVIYIICFVAVIVAFKIFTFFKLISYSRLNWQENDFANNCAFIGNNLASLKQNSSQMCRLLCIKKSDCTHYSWSGGKCSIKKGHVTKADAVYVADPNSWCEIVPKRSHELDNPPISNSSFDRLTNCKFTYGRDYSGGGVDNSDYTKFDYISIWINTIKSKCNGRNRNSCTNFNRLYHGEMLQKVKELNKIAVFYAYIIGFEAMNIKALKRCHNGQPNLCAHGANFIREYRSRIIDRYHHQSYHISKSIGTNAFCVFLIEPDFYQYYGNSSEQNNGNLSGEYMRSLFDDIVAAIKRHLPNASISWDVSSWINESDMVKWWGFFQSSEQIDYIHTSRGISEGALDEIAPNHLKWQFINKLTGKKIIADAGAGAEFPSEKNRRTWHSYEDIRTRISDGVVALTIKNPTRTPWYRPSVC